MRGPCRITTGNRWLPDTVRDVASSQAGAVARSQLLSLGTSAAWIERALGAGRLYRLYRGVYAVLPPELLSEEGRLTAALLACGPGAALARGTAAWRWGLIGAPPAVIELSVPNARAAPDGIGLLRSVRMREGDSLLDGRFPISSVPRTLLDLAVRYEREPLMRALAEAEFRYDLRPEDVLRTLRRGHPGSARLRRALEAHVPGHGAAKSGLERRFRRLLIAHGVPLPQRNAPLGRWVVDCLWPEVRVVVELDGSQHERPHQAAVDASRDLWLRRRGYTLRRYDTALLRHDAAEVTADLTAALDAGAAALPA